MPRYEIRLRGLLDSSWSEWFGGISISHDIERGESVLAGNVVDQTALYTLLIKARDLSLTLISANLIDSPEPEQAPGKK